MRIKHFLEQAKSRIFFSTSFYKYIYNVIQQNKANKETKSFSGEELRRSRHFPEDSPLVFLPWRRSGPLLITANLRDEIWDEANVR